MSGDRGPGSMGRTRWWHRRSLRLQTVVLVVLVAAAPVAWVWAGGLSDRATVRSLHRDVSGAARELAGESGGIGLGVAPSSASGGRPSAAAIARSRHVRIRGWDGSGTLVVDEDRTRLSWMDRVERALAGDLVTPTLAGFEAELAPVRERALVRDAGARPVTECRSNGDVTLLVCESAVVAGGKTWLVQRSSRRALLYDLRFRVLRVAFWVGLFALGVGTWISLRWVRPLALLRDAALDRVDRPLAAEPVGLQREDEIGELARAFDQLLVAVRQQSDAHQTFVGDLAHEMKNPVAAIRSATEALEGDAPLEPERAARIARILRSSTDRLQRVLAELLDLSRAEAGLPGDVREAVDLGALVTGVVGSMALDGVALEVEPVAVSVVPERVETLVRNLVANAVDFRGEGPVAVRVSADGEWARLDVADRGPGIPADALPRVFERFFTTRGSGSGVGLALVKAVAEAHGGSVAVQSTEGQGATFTVWLPRA